MLLLHREPRDQKRVGRTPAIVPPSPEDPERYGHMALAYLELSRVSLYQLNGEESIRYAANTVVISI